ncbi:short chain dehydrogenase family protein [Mycobacterium xenopi 4042]|uniref:Short chain dehydrogenase family protein n=1 Tax=Mycobacterium xenopi 4042 TaxID=1299334 RepID=X8BKA3_MYCXE|nr:short chain dehydrogenase family protein [Mycobacterium xenopi 4042]
MVAEIDAAAGQAVARDIGGVFVGTDVANRSEVENAVQTALSEYGSIDIVVNNAWGGGKIGRVENKTDEQLAHGIAVGYYGPYWAMRAAFPHMKARAGAV